MGLLLAYITRERDSKGERIVGERAKRQRGGTRIFAQEFHGFSWPFFFYLYVKRERERHGQREKERLRDKEKLYGMIS